MPPPARLPLSGRPPLHLPPPPPSRRGTPTQSGRPGRKRSSRPCPRRPCGGGGCGGRRGLMVGGGGEKRGTGEEGGHARWRGQRAVGAVRARAAAGTRPPAICVLPFPGDRPHSYPFFRPPVDRHTASPRCGGGGGIATRGASPPPKLGPAPSSPPSVFSIARAGSSSLLLLLSPCSAVMSLRRFRGTTLLEATVPSLGLGGAPWAGGAAGLAGRARPKENGISLAVDKRGRGWGTAPRL